MKNKFDVFAYNLIKILSVFILSSFIFMGLLTRVRIDDTEKAYMVSGGYLKLGLCMLVVLMVIYALLKFSEKIRLTPNIVFGIVMIVGIIWVMVAQNEPTDDASYCLKIAEELTDGISYSFIKGQYLDTWRQQYPLVLLLCLFTLIGGSFNYLLFQMFNVLLLALMFRETYAVVSKKSVSIANTSFVLMMLYTPIWISATYAYGNVIGMALGIMAVLRLIRYLENEENRNIRYSVEAIILIGFACAFKTFNLIFLIAIVAVFIWDLITDRKRWLNLLLMVAAVASFVLINSLSTMIIRGIVGDEYRPNGGVPMISSIVMGMDINAEDTNPGWYSAYNINTYFDSDCDSDKASEKSKSDLDEVINKALSNPVGYLKALSKKNHTVWNEPTFDMLYRNRITSPSGLRHHSAWYVNLVSPTGTINQIMMLFLSGIQIMAYLGTLLFALIKLKNTNRVWLTPLIGFLGAVMFICFWEAKSEYIFEYFVPLIVYGVAGFESIKDDQSFVLKNMRGYLPSVIVIALAAIAVVAFGRFTNNNDEWDENISTHYYLAQGNYDLTLSNSKEAVFENVYIDFDIMNSAWSYVIYTNDDRHYFEFLNWDEIDRDSFQRLAATDSAVQTCEKEETSPEHFHWVLRKTDGGFIIKWFDEQNKVWTFDENTGIILLKDYKEGNANQIWSIK